jgi:hypothetical protein
MALWTVFLWLLRGPKDTSDYELTNEELDELDEEDEEDEDDEEAPEGM